MRHPKSDSYVRNMEGVDELREQMGLPPLRRGTILCRRCNKPFHSDDIERERHCYPCRQAMEVIETALMPYAGGYSKKHPRSSEKS